MGGEVQASGEVDLDTDPGQHVWRLMKSGTIGFSFGYLIPDGGSFKRADGGRTITATPTPMNNGTRVLATKALDEHNAIREKARDDMLELLSATPEPVATKSLPLPVQIASFEA